METSANVTPAKRPAGQEAEARPVRSGEGARSALEQLIRQEQRRAAQRARDAGEGPAIAPAPRPDGP